MEVLAHERKLFRALDRREPGGRADPGVAEVLRYQWGSRGTSLILLGMSAFWRTGISVP